MVRDLNWGDVIFKGAVQRERIAEGCESRSHQQCAAEHELEFWGRFHEIDRSRGTLSLRLTESAVKKTRARTPTFNTANPGARPVFACSPCDVTPDA